MSPTKDAAHRCWRPRCRRTATERLVGDDWELWSCPADLRTAQAVTGDRPARGRGGQMELPIGGGT